jgi:hypothetical protein
MAEKLCRILATAATTHLEARGAPVHQLDTLPSFDDSKKWRKNFAGSWQQQPPTHLETRRALVHQLA